MFVLESEKKFIGIFLKMFEKVGIDDIEFEILFGKKFEKFFTLIDSIDNRLGIDEEMVSHYR